MDLNGCVQVHPAFAASPDCVAVLPLAVAEDGEPTAADAARVRLSLYARLLTQASGIRPERVDKALAG